MLVSAIESITVSIESTHFLYLVVRGVALIRDEGVAPLMGDLGAFALIRDEGGGVLIG
jgi:hypothetical protein